MRPSPVPEEAICGDEVKSEGSDQKDLVKNIGVDSCGAEAIVTPWTVNSMASRVGSL